MHLVRYFFLTELGNNGVVLVRKVEDPRLSTMACSNFKVSLRFPDGCDLEGASCSGQLGELILELRSRAGRQASGFQGESEKETDV